MKNLLNSSQSGRLRQVTQKSLLTATLLTAGIGAHADVPVYDNTTNFTGFSVNNTGAAVQSGNTITKLVADDINFAPGSAGQFITSFVFSVGNQNTTTVSARARVRFFMTDGPGGAPGTLIEGISFNAFPFAPGVTLLSTGALGTLGFTIPANGSIWAGITFDNNTGATGATIAQMNKLGQGTFDPPTVGSSQDLYFVSSAAGSNLVNNPAGTVTASPFGGNPVANFGWQFTTTAGPLVPAPSSLAVVALGGLPLVGVLRRRRAARK